MSDGRHVEFEHCFNFRDIGGYETADGRRVRRNAVFRSDSLHRLTTADLTRAQDLGVRTVIDLRSTAELTRDGRFAVCDDAVAFHHTPLFEEDTLPFTPAEPGDPEPPPGESYIAMAVAGRDALATALRVIAEGDHAVVFHCAAGKDRTGILAALVLSTLGVPDEVIIADYTLSDRALAPAIAWAEANDREWAEELATLPSWLLHAPTKVMQAFLDLLRAHHGSIDAYLTDAGFGEEHRAVLRARLLEP